MMSVSGHTNETPPSSSALAEAERWLARMRSDPSDRERAFFEQWRADPEHARAWAWTERLWQSLDGLESDPELEQMAAEALAETAPPRPAVSRGRRRHWAAAALLAAACVVAAIVTTLVVYRHPLPPPAVYTTGPSQHRTITLKDGSHVVLNIDTRIAVRMLDDARELHLLHGEALFKVAHDADRPFRVSVGGGHVTALGTHFQVSDLHDRITVTLLQGSIAVDRDPTDEHLRLRPGQQASFTQGDARHIAMRTVDPDVVSSWARGRLLFRATPLAKVIAEVNRYAKTKLRLTDPALASTPISGTFPLGDSKSVALGLQAMLPLKADAGTPGWITLRHR